MSDTQEFIYGKVEQMLGDILGKYESTTKELAEEITKQIQSHQQKIKAKNMDKTIAKEGKKSIKAEIEKYKKMEQKPKHRVKAPFKQDKDMER